MPPVRESQYKRQSQFCKEDCGSLFRRKVVQLMQASLPSSQPAGAAWRVPTCCRQGRIPESLGRTGGRPDYDTEERGGPATDPKHVPKDGSNLAPGTGKRPCSDGDIDDAKGLVLRGAGH